MAMGRRRRHATQASMWVATQDKRPLIAMSEEARFAHDDTARRLEGLREVLAEVEDDLTALDA